MCTEIRGAAVGANATHVAEASADPLLRLLRLLRHEITTATKSKSWKLLLHVHKILETD